MRIRIPRIAVASAVLPLGVLAWAEWMHWRASVRGVARRTERVEREAVVVLGFKNRGATANYLNRYRVRAGLRSIGPNAGETVLVLCGGTVGGDVPEAELLLRYARDRGYDGAVKLDTESVTTWENIENAIPLIEDCERVKIASNSLHAEKARAYLRRQRPDLAARLARANDYQLGEIALVKPVAAMIGIRALRILRRT